MHSFSQIIFEDLAIMFFSFIEIDKKNFKILASRTLKMFFIYPINYAFFFFTSDYLIPF